MAIFQVSFLSNCLGRTVPIMVVLPTDKMTMPGMPQRDPDKPFKTLYLLHGIIGSCGDWLYGTRIQRWAEEHDLAVVMPSGDNAMYLDNPVDKYGEYIGRELVEFTRRSFPLSHKKEDTFIGGLSMGGFGALRNGLKYSGTFGAIVALSSALVVDENLLVPVEHPIFPSDAMDYRQWIYGKDLKQALESDVNPSWLVKDMVAKGAEFPAIFMAVGESDFLLDKNEKFHALLVENRVEHTYITGPGAHEWDFWDTYIKKAIDWLPLEDASAGKSSGNVL
ncbi:MAG: acetylesterase [Lachnospiraceae bacterium]|nr:acetylesterase [Lachnospiraceae bacterium]